MLSFLFFFFFLIQNIFSMDKYNDGMHFLAYHNALKGMKKTHIFKITLHSCHIICKDTVVNRSFKAMELWLSIFCFIYFFCYWVVFSGFKVCLFHYNIGVCVIGDYIGLLLPKVYCPFCVLQKFYHSRTELYFRVECWPFLYVNFCWIFFFRFACLEACMVTVNNICVLIWHVYHSFVVQINSNMNVSK